MPIWQKIFSRNPKMNLKKKYSFKKKIKMTTSEKHFRLGTMFYRGDFVDQDFVEARRQFELGWEKKDLKSGFNYAKMLYDGIGGEKDTYAAYIIFHQIADDYPDAYYEMYNSNNTRGVEDLINGQKKGSRKCALKYGMLIENTNANIAMESYEFAMTSAEDDEIKLKACECLGMLKRKHGLKIEAINYLTYTSENRSDIARYHLGLIHLENGKPRDAMYEFELASEGGNDHATFELIKIRFLLLADMDELRRLSIFAKANMDQLRRLHDRCIDVKLKEEISIYLGDYYLTNKNVWEAYEWYSKAKASKKINQLLSDELDVVEQKYKEGYIEFCANHLEEIKKRCPATGDLIDRCCYFQGCIAEEKDEYDIALMFFDDGIGYDGCKYRYADLLLTHYGGLPDLNLARFHINHILENSKEIRWLELAKEMRKSIDKQLDSENTPSEISEDYIEISPSEVEPEVEPPVEPAVEPMVEPEVEPEVEPPVEPAVEPLPEYGARPAFISSMERLFRAKEETPDSIYLIGYLYMLSGDIEGAKIEFKKSARMGHRDSLIKLGELSLDE